MNAPASLDTLALSEAGTNAVGFVDQYLPALLNQAPADGVGRRSVGPSGFMTPSGLKRNPVAIG